jgi:hypothetical protein
MNEQQNDFKKKLEEQNKTTAPQDLIEKVKKQRNENKEKVKEKSKNVVLFLPLIFSTIITLLLLGFIELVNARFDFRVLTSADFWYKFVIFQFSLVLITLAITFTLIKLQRRKNQKYLENNEKIQAHVDRDNLNPYIDDGALEEDIDRRVKAWKRKNKIKIEKWRRKIKYKPEIKDENGTTSTDSEDLLSYESFSNNDHNFIIPNTKWFKTTIKTVLEKHKIKRNIKIRNKIEYYTHMLSDEYILKNIDNLKVKYNKITSQALTSGVNPTNSENGNEPLKAKRLSILLRKNASRILISAGSTALITSMVLDLQEMDLTSWIRILTKLIIVIYNSFMAFVDSDDYFEVTDLYESSVRVQVLNKIEYKKKGNVKV